MKNVELPRPHENPKEIPVFFYNFPDGKRVEINKNQEGETEIFIKNKGGEKIFDFGSLLPAGFKFVDYELAIRIDPRLRYFKRGPRTDLNFKIIEIDGFDGPEIILCALHEIGHAKFDPDSYELKRGDEIAESFKNFPGKEKEIALAKEDYKILSVTERRAWAYALNTARELRKKFGIDLKSVFPTFADFKNYANKYLASYRKEAESEILFDDPDFEKELKRLFDKPN